MVWLPMFALPNIHVKEPVETASLALVNAEHERAKSLAAAHPNFATYLKQFSTEFGVTRCGPPGLPQHGSAGRF
jgi:hypothetical protein